MPHALTGTSSTPTESVPAAQPPAAGVPTDQIMTFHPRQELSQLDPAQGPLQVGPLRLWVRLPTYRQNQATPSLARHHHARDPVDYLDLLHTH